MTSLAVHASRSVVRSLAAFGLPNARPLGAVSREAFPAVLAAAKEERVTGWLVAAIEANALAVDDDLAGEAFSVHEDVLGADLLLEALLRDTSRQFRDLGVAHRALKGPVVARTVYRDPGFRSFRDIDVLVAGRDFDRAVRALELQGGVARFREPRPNFTARFGKGVCVTTGVGLEIDLHRVFTAGPFGLAIEVEELFGYADTISLGGTAVPVLRPVHQFLHACYHAALGDRTPRLTALRDVAEFVVSDKIDVADALAVAQRWRSRAVVQRALDLVRSDLDVDLGGPWYDWSERYEPDRFERAACRVYTSTAGYAAKAATGIWAVHGTRNRAAYAVALVLPSREYLSERDGTYRKRLWRSLRLAREWKAGS